MTCHFSYSKRSSSICPERHSFNRERRGGFREPQVNTLYAFSLWKTLHTLAALCSPTQISDNVKSRESSSLRVLCQEFSDSGESEMRHWFSSLLLIPKFYSTWQYVRHSDPSLGSLVQLTLSPYPLDSAVYSPVVVLSVLLLQSGRQQSYSQVWGFSCGWAWTEKHLGGYMAGNCSEW